MHCLRRRSGSMRLERGARPRFKMDISLNPMGMILTWMSLGGTTAIRMKKPIRLHRRTPIFGGCMIWRGMCGSGALTGSGIICQVQSPILQDPKQAPAAWIVAAAGTTVPGTAVRRIATGTSQASGTTTWASASPGHSSFEFSPFYILERVSAMGIGFSAQGAGAAGKGLKQAKREGPAWGPSGVSTADVLHTGFLYPGGTGGHIPLSAAFLEVEIDEVRCQDTRNPCFSQSIFPRPTPAHLTQRFA